MPTAATSSVWEPDAEPTNPIGHGPSRILQSVPRTRDGAVPAPVLARLAELIAILERPFAAGETAEAGARRKEHDLGAVFATLSVVDSWHLHQRLRRAAPGDRLSAAFGRLVVQRRDRLLAFLGDARRRQVIAGGRR
jgi:hypothetical protein